MLLVLPLTQTLLAGQQGKGGGWRPVQAEHGQTLEAAAARKGRLLEGGFGCSG